MFHVSETMPLAQTYSCGLTYSGGSVHAVFALTDYVQVKPSDHCGKKRLTTAEESILCHIINPTNATSQCPLTLNYSLIYSV